MFTFMYNMGIPSQYKRSSLNMAFKFDKLYTSGITWKYRIIYSYIKVDLFITPNNVLNCCFILDLDSES